MQAFRPHLLEYMSAGEQALPSILTGSLLQEYVDPNEPKYCICNQPSQGDMIGCDNPACTREWFHNICVGIQTPPEKWFCPECREACEGLPTKEASEGPPPKRSTRRS